MTDRMVGLQLDAVPAPRAHEEDSALLDGLRCGLEDAYEALIQRFEQPIFNVVSRLLDDPSEAADVVQEVFLKVFRNVSSFRGESSMKTWIYRIAVNEARNQRRWFSRHRRQEVNLDPEDAGDGFNRSYRNWLPDPGRSPYEVTLDHETQSLIEGALSEVNPKFRAALVLREIEGMSYEEIAEILEISLGTVKSRILRGREALKKNLAGRLEPASPSEWSSQHVAVGLAREL
ncbi:MAG TPA: sigma-70 family RNA polymerase sigma factor [Bryobacteraceae bacterium]|nr:sigma-70 family RNA polymerase sigma factor [Bryobacteraceae bacterium]